PLALLLRDADQVGEPAPVGGEGGLVPPGGDAGAVVVDAAEAQLVLLVDAADAVGDPLSVRREGRVLECLPLAVVGRRDDRLLLGRDRRRGDEEKQGGEDGSTTSHGIAPGRRYCSGVIGMIGGVVGW